MRRIAVLDAPSNLGLRPPTPTSVPGCAKAPGALRDHGLVARLAARDAGCVTPPRYDPGDWRPGDGVAQADEIAIYTRRLADRIETILRHGEFPVVLGGDCSIVLAAALATRRRTAAAGGRAGLVYVDGHSDFRHPGNASYVGAAAGEGLALATGRGQADLAAIEALRPYFRDRDVVVLGVRTHDDYRLDLQAAGIAVRAVPQLRAEGAARSAQWARGLLADCVGYWVHVDVDVLDPAVMPAVDAPDPGGIAYAELERLLANLVATPSCLGVEVTVFDPDYDPTGDYAGEVVDALVGGLAPAAGVPALGWGAPAAGTPAAGALSAGVPTGPAGDAADRGADEPDLRWDGDEPDPADGYRDEPDPASSARDEPPSPVPAPAARAVGELDPAVGEPGPAVRDVGGPDLTVGEPGPAAGGPDPAAVAADEPDGFDPALPPDPWAQDDPAFLDGYQEGWAVVPGGQVLAGTGLAPAPAPVDEARAEVAGSAAARPGAAPDHSATEPGARPDRDHVEQPVPAAGPAQDDGPPVEAPAAAPRPRRREDLAGLADQVRAAVSGLGTSPDPGTAAAPGRLRRRPATDPAGSPVPVVPPAGGSA